MKGLIADTGPLYAAIDPDDQYHRQAQAELDQIAAENLTVIVSIPVLLESYSLILYRLGTKQAATFAEEIPSVFQLINPSQAQYLAAIAKAAQFSDQRITLFDAVTAVMAEEMTLAVWTYDYHFDVMQTRVWR